jgi:hypothetical protein
MTPSERPYCPDHSLLQTIVEECRESKHQFLVNQTQIMTSLGEIKTDLAIHINRHQEREEIARRGINWQDVLAHLIKWGAVTALAGIIMLLARYWVSKGGL